MDSTLTFNYPYDDSPETHIELLSRCKEYDFSQFDSSMFTSMFSLLYLNIRSAPSKLDELNIWLSSLSAKPNIICLTETWFQSNAPSGSLPGYSIVNVRRVSCKGGGVCLYMSLMI